MHQSWYAMVRTYYSAVGNSNPVRSSITIHLLLFSVSWYEPIYLHTTFSTTFDSSIPSSIKVPPQSSKINFCNAYPASARLADALCRHTKHLFPHICFCPLEHSPRSNSTRLNLISVKAGTGTTPSQGWSARMRFSMWQHATTWIMCNLGVSRNTFPQMFVHNQVRWQSVQSNHVKIRQGKGTKPLKGPIRA